jgi:iron complex outermembrane receptor protein
MGNSMSFFPASRGRFFIVGATIFGAGLILSGTSFAQTDCNVIGQVVDSISGDPVSGAMISIDNTGRMVLSDQSGRFHFRDLKAGAHNISVARIGFLELGPIQLEISYDMPTTVFVRLQQKAIEVDAQTVIAKRPAPVQIFTQGNVTKLTFSPGTITSIEKLVELLPELELIGSGRQRSLRLRGSQANGVLLLLDGRLQNLALTSQGDLSTISLGSVTGVEIVKGGNYQLPGLAGSVNFTTAPPTFARASSFAERGSFGFESYAATLFTKRNGGVVGSIDLGSQSSRGDFEFLDPRHYWQVRANNHSHDRKAFLQSGIIRNNFSLLLKGRYFDRVSGMPGPIFQYTPYAASTSFERELYLLLRRRINDKFGVDINTGILSRTIHFNSPATPTNFIPYDSRFSERTRDIAVLLQSRSRIDLNSIFSFRYEALDGADNIRPGASFGRHSRNTLIAGVGLQSEIPIPFRLFRSSNINCGLRAENIDGSTFWGPSFTYRVNFDLPADPGFDISSFRSRRPPNLTDIYWKEDIFAAPNPDIRSEKSSGYAVGADWRLTKGQLLNFRITNFVTSYDDLIIWRQWGGDKFKPVNLSSAVISGWEMSLSSRPFSGPLIINWAGSIMEPLNTEKNTVYYHKYLTFRPLQSHRVTAEYELGALKIKISGRHIGRRFITEENTKHLPPVDPFDISTAYDLILRSLTISVSFNVLNAGDVQYELLERIPEKPREYRLKLQLSKL